MKVPKLTAEQQLAYIATFDESIVLAEAGRRRVAKRTYETKDDPATEEERRIKREYMRKWRAENKK